LIGSRVCLTGISCQISGISSIHLKMKKKRQPTRADLVVCSIIFRLMRTLGRIPRPLARKVGNFLGDAGFRLDRRHREITLNNLAFAMGAELDDKQRWHAARAIYRNLGQILFEVGWSLWAPPAELNRCIRIDGLDNYRAALEKGKGVLAITAHIGNWELLSIVAHRMDMPINVLYRPLDFMPLNLFFEKLRGRFGARLISTSHAMLRILRALKDKEVLAILMDQSVDWYDGVWVDFFGRRTCTSKGMALIALKTGAPVLPVFLYREASGFRAVFDEEIPLVATGDKTSDIESNTLNYSKAIEKGIRRHPEQWFWVHRRWKNRPYCLWPKSPS
jgi:KDO2-lipid IV(A) lauroyltransferase